MKILNEQKNIDKNIKHIQKRFELKKLTGTFCPGVSSRFKDSFPDRTSSGVSLRCKVCNHKNTAESDNVFISVSVLKKEQ